MSGHTTVVCYIQTSVDCVKKEIQVGTQREFQFVAGLKKEKGVKSWGKSSSAASPPDWVLLLIDSQR